MRAVALVTGYIREFDDGLIDEADIETLATYHDIKKPRFFGSQSPPSRDRFLGMLRKQMRQDMQALGR